MTLFTSTTTDHTRGVTYICTTMKPVLVVSPASRPRLPAPGSLLWELALNGPSPSRSTNDIAHLVHNI